MPNRVKKQLQPYPPECFDASGAFETCRVRKARVIHQKEHMSRLEGSLKTLGISPLETGVLERELARAARKVGEGFVRVAVRRVGRPRIIIHEEPHLPYKRKELDHGISVVTAATRQPGTQALPAQAKYSERLSSILARMEGKIAPEILRLNSLGFLTEGTVSNLFIVKEGELLTPPTWLGVLEGVTRDQVFQVARRLRIPMRETPLTRHDLFCADEAFLTNVLMGVGPIREVDGRRIGAAVPGPITRCLMKAMRKG